MQEDMVIPHEPLDLLLTCVRQVLLLAKPRDKQIPDSIVGPMDGDTTPSILRPAAEASQDANPNQVTGFGMSTLGNLLACLCLLLCSECLLSKELYVTVVDISKISLYTTSYFVNTLVGACPYLEVQECVSC